MNVYRVELWCDQCVRHYALGTPHDDLNVLPVLAKNLEEMAERDGWVKSGAAHFCPRCQIQETTKA